MKHFLWIFIFCVCANPSKSWTQQDSLMTAWGVYEKINAPALPQKDTVLALQIQTSIMDVIQTKPFEAIHRAHLLLRMSKKLNFPNGISAGFLQLANTHLNVQQLDSADYYVNNGILYCQTNGRQRQLMVGWVLRGNLHFYRSEYDEALEDYFAALKVSEEFYPKESADHNASIGMVFWTIENLGKAQTYLEKSYQLAKVYKDTSDQIYALNNLGIVCKKQNNFEKAKEYYEIGLDLAILTGSLRRESEFVYNLANVYFEEGNYDEGFKLLNRSAEITELIGTDRDRAIEYANYGQHLLEVGNLTEAYHYILRGLEYARTTNYWQVELEALEGLSLVSSKLGKYKEAYEYSQDLIRMQDSLDLNTVNSEALAIEELHKQEQQALKDSLLQEKFDLEEAHQKRLHNEKVKAKDNLLFIALIVIALVIIGLVFLFRTNNKVKQKNLIITERNALITHQKDEIEEQHKEITDSINYAQRIQNALISGNEEWDKISIDHFILFQPKDVVSGDFYWAHHSEEENISIWVTADCTGHGVPGAFMSMLGIGFLNEIIVENEERSGPKILDLLRKKIINALEQKGTEFQQKDGMDLALCIWNKNNDMLEFTGANNPLWIIRRVENDQQEKLEKITAHDQNGYSLIEFGANKFPVGFHSEEDKKYVSKNIQLQKEDLILSFTDGYADQFGGERGKKLKYKPFKNMLLDIRPKSIKLHSEFLSRHFHEWKGEHEQIDDVCVIGVKVN